MKKRENILHLKGFEIDDNGVSIYNWFMVEDDVTGGDLLQFSKEGKTYRIYLLDAWPTQLAGPRLKELHKFKTGKARESVLEKWHHLIEKEYE